MNQTEIPFRTITGDITRVADFEAKGILVVNVASECGYTPQYADLEQLYRDYKDHGLVVVGFPANNFGGQEPGTNKEILEFCRSRFDVTFPLMAKVSVTGDDKHPLFTYLTEQSSHPGEIEWNFTKFLLSSGGSVIARYPSSVKPTSDEFVTEVEKLLGM